MEPREHRLDAAVFRLEQAIGKLETAIGNRLATDAVEIRHLSSALAKAEQARPTIGAQSTALDQSVLERLDYTIGRLRGLITP
jgi:hypothetical protein